MDLSKNVQIDLITHENLCVFSRRSVRNTLQNTIDAANERSISLERLNIEKTISTNNQHLRSKIQNYLVVHSDLDSGKKILDNLKEIGHWGTVFQTSYAAIIRYLKNPYIWSSMIMDGDQSSDYSLKLIAKIQSYKPQSKIIILSDKKSLVSQFDHLNITYLPKNFNPQKHLAPVF